MVRSKSSAALIAAIVLVSVFAYYRIAADIFSEPKQVETADAPKAPATEPGKENDALPAGSRKLTAETRFEVPNDGVDHVRFTVVVDGSGTIRDARVEDAKTGEENKYHKEFSEGLAGVIKGRKMDELTAIDRIGKSSLTTDAFNGVIGDLKSEL
jgi:hypothetical protein